VLRFHLPLIKPDVRFSRIRLSDKVSCVRPRKGACFRTQPDQAQLLFQVLVGESRFLRTPMELVLRTQPLAEPMSGVLIDQTIRLAHRSQEEVIRPAAEQVIY
jgi:hypothetical protein